MNPNGKPIKRTLRDKEIVHNVLADVQSKIIKKVPKVKITDELKARLAMVSKAVETKFTPIWKFSPTVMSQDDAIDQLFEIYMDELDIMSKDDLRHIAAFMLAGQNAQNLPT